jgi:8-oxo-dGTP diphosphatase
MKTRYVVGYLFNNDGTAVILLRKTHPEWQAGKLNGVGGRVEENETPAACIEREFLEETGVPCNQWQFTIHLEGPDFIVFYYRAYSSALIQAVMGQKSYPTDEKPELWPISLPTGDLVRNVPWTMNLSNDKDGVYFPVEVKNRGTQSM